VTTDDDDGGVWILFDGGDVFVMIKNPNPFEVFEAFEDISG